MGINHPGEKKNSNAPAGGFPIAKPGPQRTALPVDIANAVDAAAGDLGSETIIDNLVLNPAAF